MTVGEHVYLHLVGVTGFEGRGGAQRFLQTLPWVTSEDYCLTDKPDIVFRVDSSGKCEITQKVSQNKQLHMYSLSKWQEVVFQDRKRYQEMRQQLQLYREHHGCERLTLWQHLFLFKLNFHDHAFCNTLGFVIQQLGFRQLDLSGNGIRTLEYLADRTALGYTDLRVLVLDDNHLESIAPLMRLGSRVLRYVTLHRNPIVDRREYAGMQMQLSIAARRAPQAQTVYLPAVNQFASNNHHENKFEILQYILKCAKGLVEHTADIPIRYIQNDNFTIADHAETRIDVLIRSSGHAFACAPTELHTQLCAQLGTKDLVFLTENAAPYEDIIDCPGRPGQKVARYQYITTGKINKRAFRRTTEVLALISVMAYQFAQHGELQKIWIRDEVLIIE